ncbi:MAG: hypothetical protein KatS3mg054_1074 [Chloroflexus sp.]|nr:MAG: hypothetical protein KatS3mg054_1074 [Chloroflexus sp.]
MKKSSLYVGISGLVATIVMSILLLIVVVIPLEWRRYEASQWPRLADSFHARILLKGVETVYERVPIIYILDTYSRSAFYPFVQLVPTCDAKNISMNYSIKNYNNKYFIEFYSTIVYKDKTITITGVQKDLPDEVQRTRMLFAAYLKGTRWWYKLIRQARIETEEHTNYVIKISSKWCKYTAIPRPIPVLPPYNLPRTPQEAEHYIQWLSTVTGLQPLVDGWGQAVHWEVRAGHLNLRSAGADHRWNTADDIVVQLQLMPGAAQVNSHAK